MLKKINNWIGLVFCSQFLGAQIDVRFIEHLITYSLQTEHLAYLNSFKEPADSLSYFEAKYYLSYFNDTLFLKNYMKSKLLCESDSNLLNQAGPLMLNTASKKTRILWFDALPEKINSLAVQRLVAIYNAAEKPGQFTGENSFPEELRKSFYKYKKVANKKPVLAAGMSLVVPGLGKLYAGKTKSGLSTLLINSAYAAQSWESYTKLGIRHPLTVFNVAAFAVFYFSNIYGGYKCIIDLRRERKKQFIKDATFLYY